MRPSGLEDAILSSMAAAKNRLALVSGAYLYIYGPQ